MPGYCSKFILFIILTIGLSGGAIFGQTSGFTYQGRLTDGGTPANGNYDLQFVLFDAADGNNQIGQTQTISNVPVSGGVFTVTLDFGASAFAGPARFLEISTRPVSAGSFTLLTPRQPIASTPYAVRSLNTATADLAMNAQQLGGVAAAQFVKTDDTRMSDQRDPKTGSSNYIQNTTSTQSSSDFNISGNGTAGGTLSGNVLNASSQFNIGGQRVLGVHINNQNTFLGVGAGTSQTMGTQNSFFGTAAGLKNTSGSYNSFFGNEAGLTNTTGYGNAFFGTQAGKSNTTGNNNVLIGDQAGVSITSGSYNTAIGDGAGYSVTTEDNNTFIGVSANGLPGVTNATAIGANATVTQSNTVVLGNDASVGIGTTEPWAKLQVEGSNNGLRVGTSEPWSTLASFGGHGNFMIDAPGIIGGRFSVRQDGKVGVGSFFVSHKFEVRDEGNSGLRVENDLSGGTVASFGGSGDFMIDAPSIVGGRFSVRQDGKVGIGSAAPSAKLDVNGNIKVRALGTAGNTQLCQNSTTFEIATCSSSLRYKTDLRPFSRGLDVINRLRPITFKWKTDRTLDLGFGAEDVAAVEPLLVTHNQKGQVEGVKYDRLSVVFINAFKEQQAQIEQQEAEAKQLRAEAMQLKAAAAEQKAVAQQQRKQIALLRESNEALNARLSLLERSFKRRGPRSRR